MSEIQVSCKAAKYLPLDALQDFQGSLKKLSKEDHERLRNQIVNQGFSFPVCVWEDEEKTAHILDGHQRTKVLRQLREDGYSIPDIPVALVQAESYGEAKKKLLAAASQFGEVDGIGLQEFLAQSGVALEDIIQDIRFPEINLEQFIDGYESCGIDDLGGDVEVPELDEYESDQEETDHVKMVQLVLSEETAPKFLNWVDFLQDHFEVDNITDAVALAVGAAYERISG